jgi:predicted outer membrane repeat protein
MLSLLLCFRAAWEDFFPGNIQLTTYNKQKYTSQQTLSGTNVYVLSCLFSKCTSASNGGAFYCTSATYLLVESTSFFSCKTSNGNGGAIFFDNTNSNGCVLNKVCGNDCCTTSSSTGLFSYTRVKNAASSKNYINYSSIARCVEENSVSYRTFYIYYGKIHCPSVNSSMNKNKWRSGISCEPSTDSSSVIASLTYSTIADNNASEYRVVYFNNGGSIANFEIKCCNIIRNTHIDKSYGIIEAYGNLTIEDSSILENTANYIFYTSSSNRIITLSNCTVDNTVNSTGNLILQNTVSKSFILALNHMSTELCVAEYDSAGTLTPVISKQIVCYYTCKQFFSQSPIRDFISLLFVFAFNLINPYPSGGH